MGTLFPIIMFLVVQTGGAIWWASSIHSQVSQIAGEFDKFDADHDAENLRQWSRINAAEGNIQAIVANERATAAEIKSLNEALSELRFDIRENNNLIREWLSQGVIIDGSRN